MMTQLDQKVHNQRIKMPSSNKETQWSSENNEKHLMDYISSRKCTYRHHLKITRTYKNLDYSQ